MEAKQNPTKFSLVCGVDECGIGSAIAEVYVASCILDPKKRIKGMADSKKLAPKRRKELSDQIQERALDFCIATASLEEIECLNVLYASHLGMVRAIDGLRIRPDLVLIDGNKIPKGLTIPARAIVKGDATIPAISAASILAKVARDEAMMTYHQQYPHYGFDVHKGYLTPPHFAALNQYGPCPVHRKSYAPIRALLVVAASRPGSPEIGP
jgi:ribonuclease HII